MKRDRKREKSIRPGGGKRAFELGFLLLLAAVVCAGCSVSGQKKDGSKTGAGEENGAESGMNAGQETGGKETGTDADGAGLEQDAEETGMFGESAADGHIDFAMLKEQNPEIFAWLYIPGTDIDLPVLQSCVSDEFYITHDAAGEESGVGAVYTEMPNLMDMCDFNTVIHGNDLEEDGPLKALHHFEDADFFVEHETFYLYLPDNVLTYEIFASYYDEGSDILRRHDYTTFAGCQEYLDEIYGMRSMNRNFREGWEGLTPWHFLVTLNGLIREDGTQYVVIGALTEDAAGKIDRIIYE